MALKEELLPRSDRPTPLMEKIFHGLHAVYDRELEITLSGGGSLFVAPFLLGWDSLLPVTENMGWFDLSDMAEKNGLDSNFAFFIMVTAGSGDDEKPPHTIIYTDRPTVFFLESFRRMYDWDSGHHRVIPKRLSEAIFEALEEKRE